MLWTSLTAAPALIVAGCGGGGGRPPDGCALTIPIPWEDQAWTGMVDEGGCTFEAERP